MVEWMERHKLFLPKHWMMEKKEKKKTKKERKVRYLPKILFTIIFTVIANTFNLKIITT